MCSSVPGREIDSGYDRPKTMRPGPRLQHPDNFRADASQFSEDNASVSLQSRSIPVDPRREDFRASPECCRSELLAIPWISTSQFLVKAKLLEYGIAAPHLCLQGVILNSFHAASVAFFAKNAQGRPTKKAWPMRPFASAAAVSVLLTIAVCGRNAKFITVHTTMP